MLKQLTELRKTVTAYLLKFIKDTITIEMNNQMKIYIDLEGFQVQVVFPVKLRCVTLLYVDVFTILTTP